MRKTYQNTEIDTSQPAVPEMGSVALPSWPPAYVHLPVASSCRGVLMPIVGDSPGRQPSSPLIEAGSACHP